MIEVKKDLKGILDCLPDDFLITDTLKEAWESKDILSFSIISNFFDEGDVSLSFCSAILSDNIRNKIRTIEILEDIYSILFVDDKIDSKIIAEELNKIDKNSEDFNFIDLVFSLMKKYPNYHSIITEVENSLNFEFNYDDEKANYFFYEVVENIEDCNFLSYESLKLFLKDSDTAFEELQLDDKTIDFIKSHKYFSLIQFEFLKNSIDAIVSSDEDSLNEAGINYYEGIIRMLLILDIDEKYKKIAVSKLQESYSLSDNIENKILLSLFYKFLLYLFNSIDMHLPSYVNYNTMMKSFNNVEYDKKILLWTLYYMKRIDDSFYGDKVNIFVPEEELLKDVFYFIVDLLSLQDIEANYKDIITKINNNKCSYLSKIIAEVDEGDGSFILEILEIFVFLFKSKLKLLEEIYDLFEEDDIIMRAVKNIELVEFQ